MGQAVAKLKSQPSKAGLSPRSEAARRRSDGKAVARLIERELLAPCWEPRAASQGRECPVCMDSYSRLNRTACCHQDICTECFITIAAADGAVRCPYCQADWLQVYLPRPGRPGGQRGPGARQAGAATPRAPRRAASVGAAACAERHAGLAHSASVGGLCRLALGGGQRLGCDALLLRRPDLGALAAAAARASGQRCAIVAMVLAHQPLPHSRTPPAVTEPPAPASVPAPAPASAPASPLAPAPASPAAEPPPAEGPALLLHPDGTQQLVLLSRGQPASASQPQQQQQGAEAATYCPPACLEDERMRAAIARADAAMRRQRPAPSAAREGDWLARVAAADAALQCAVARNDQQRFGGGADAARPAS